MQRSKNSLNKLQQMSLDSVGTRMDLAMRVPPTCQPRRCPSMMGFVGRRAVRAGSGRVGAMAMCVCVGLGIRHGSGDGCRRRRRRTPTSIRIIRIAIRIIRIAIPSHQHPHTHTHHPSHPHPHCPSHSAPPLPIAIAQGIRQQSTVIDETYGRRKSILLQQLATWTEEYIWGSGGPYDCLCRWRREEEEEEERANGGGTALNGTWQRMGNS